MLLLQGWGVWGTHRTKETCKKKRKKVHRGGRAVLRHLLQGDQPRGAVACAACEPWALGAHSVLCPLSSQKYARYENMLPTGLCYVGGWWSFSPNSEKNENKSPLPAA